MSNRKHRRQQRRRCPPKEDFASGNLGLEQRNSGNESCNLDQEKMLHTDGIAKEVETLNKRYPIMVEKGEGFDNCDLTTALFLLRDGGFIMLCQPKDKNLM